MAKGFQHLQYQFTQRIRYGDEKRMPDNVESERMQVYQNLLFNNVFEVFNQCFPVLSELLPDHQSADLIRKFLKYRHCTTPYFHHLPHELVEFFFHQEIEEYPFLAQLAHYEWLELELEISEDIVLEYCSNEIDLSSILVLSPHIRVQAYDYEVEKIGKQYQPKKKLSSYLLLYRDESYQVLFIKLNQQSYELIQSLMQKYTLEEILKHLCTKFPEISPQDLIAGTIDLIEQWQRKQIILGTLPP